MEFELVIFLVMLGVFLLGNFLLKLPVSLSMAAGAIAGALVGGEGIPLRHLFEGTFVYMDTVLIISMAMIFMTVIQKSGALEALNAVIVSRFHKVPAVMLILLMLIIMFPGMITGSSTAAVLSAGAIVAPILLMMGIPAPQTGAILAVGAIMGMAAALEDACAHIDENARKVSALRDRLIAGLSKIPHSALNGDPVNRLPGNVSFCFEGIEGESFLLLLDAKGICASSGSACTSGSLDPSHVLLAIGRPHEVAHGSLRLSLCEWNTDEDVDRILAAVPEVVAYLREMSPMWKDLISGRKPFIL